MRPSRLLGPLLGAALCAALLGPQVDRDALIGQIVARALAEDLDATWPDPALAGPGATPAVPGTIFAALVEVSGERPPATVALTTHLQGRPDFHSPALRRGLASCLNRWAAARGEGPPVLVPDGAPAELHLRLRLAETGGRLAVAAELSGPSGTREALPAGATSLALPARGALLPPLIAILVALTLRRVLLALFLGILGGAVLLALAAHPEASLPEAFGRGLLDVFAVYLRRELVDTFRIEIIGFVVALVATVGVMSRCGGMAGLVDRLLRFARSVRSTLAVTYAMGLTIFFDDYTNCLLVGNTMRPLCDRLRIAREKLAWIVDSTAAPVAGLSLLSTWIAFEVSTFEAQLPGVGIAESGYAVFLRTVPFRYYCWFTLLFVALVIFSRRDFGPMLAAERRARTTGRLVREGGRPMVSREATRIEPKPGVPHDWRAGAAPIATVLLMTLVRIFLDGGGWELLRDDPARLLTLPGITGLLDAGSGAGPIFVGALCGYGVSLYLAGGPALRAGLLGGLALAALLRGVVYPWLAARVGEVGAGYLAWTAPIALAVALSSALSAGRARTAGAARPAAPDAGARRAPRPHLDGRDLAGASFASLRALAFAILILLQAWMIGAVCRDVATADYLVALLSGGVPAEALPVLLFVVSGLVATATGSSWSTMSILLPNVVALAAAVGEGSEIGAYGMVVLCIGSVLEGSIFGDHCSPISDTTVLSSVSAACDHVDHVRTQMPYALLCAALAIVLGYLPAALLPSWPLPVAAALAGLAMWFVLRRFGGRPEDGAEPAAAREAP